MALNTKGTERELKIQRTWKFFVNYKRLEKRKKHSFSIKYPSTRASAGDPHPSRTLPPLIGPDRPARFGGDMVMIVN